MITSTYRMKKIAYVNIHNKGCTLNSPPIERKVTGCLLSFE